MFDIVPYNYLFNRSTAFLDSEFVRSDHEMLEQVLRNLSLKGKQYLNQLGYFRKQLPTAA